MQIHLFSTTDVTADRQVELRRMLTSIEAFATQFPQHACVLHILFQRCGGPNEVKTPYPQGVQIRAQTIDRQVPLSLARNMLLGPVLDAGEIPADALVAFPDDDGWYPDGLLERIVRQFESLPGLGFLFCRYGSQPHHWLEGEALGPRAASAKDVVRNASSNTIFVSGAVARRVGLFDEALGLGTPNHGAEDLDYALRAYLAGAETFYIDDKLVGHRDKTAGLRSKYYKGGLITLGRYGQKRAALGFEYLRKLVIGLHLCVTRELDYSTFASAVKASLAAMREGAGPSR